MENFICKKIKKTNLKTLKKICLYVVKNQYTKKKKIAQ